jgi:hypothetical protein
MATKKSYSKAQIERADKADKKAGRKPTSFLIKMLAKMPRHERELAETIERRLARTK